MAKGYFIRELIYNYNKEDLDTRLDLDQALLSLTLSDKDQQILEHMKNQYSCNEISAVLGIGPDAVSEHQKKICSLLAEKLGEEYQDSKIFESTRMKLGRELTEEEIEFIYFVLRHSRAKYTKKLTIHTRTIPKN